MNSQAGGTESAATPVATRRAQSETIGIVLILGIMLLGALAVVALGATAISDTEDQLSEQRAEKAMTQFDSKAGLVALGEADSQRVSFPTDTGEQFKVVQDGSWMNISFTNQSTDYTEEIANVTLGSVVYERDDAKIAYQGGGVFREGEGGGTMVAPPEFHFRNGTLTLPTVNITGDEALGNSATITQNGVERHFPVHGSTNKTNPLDNHIVTVTVGSEYYRGWGEYFEDRTDGEVKYDHDNETVELTLVSPIEVRTLTSATSSLAPNGEFIVSGNAASQCASDVYTDSYNSSGTSDDYCDQFNNGNTGNNGDIVYGEDVTIDSGAGKSDFHGEIESGGTVTVQTGGNGAPYIYGNISYTDNCNPSVSDCENRLKSPGQDVTQVSGVRTAAAIDWHVNATVEQVRDDNDNAGASITGDQLDFGGSTTVTLDSGNYYLQNIELESDETLELDTSNGPITLVVEENVLLKGTGGSAADINVSGDGYVELYIEGENIGSADHLNMQKSTAITNANDNGTMFRTYGKEDFNATIGGGQAGNLAKYVGVLYAPPGNSGNGQVDIDGGELFGGILTGTTTVDGGSIHFDEALGGNQIISGGAKVIKVTFLHVTVNKITIEGS